MTSAWRTARRPSCASSPTTSWSRGWSRAKEELFNLRFQLATGQLDNPARMKQVRHDVARIATVLREREIELELDAIVSEEENEQ